MNKLNTFVVNHVFKNDLKVAFCDKKVVGFVCCGFIQDSEFRSAIKVRLTPSSTDGFAYPVKAPYVHLSLPLSSVCCDHASVRPPFSSVCIPSVRPSFLASEVRLL